MAMEYSSAQAVEAQEYGSRCGIHHCRRAVVTELCSGYKQRDVGAAEGEMARRHNRRMDSAKQHLYEVDSERVVQAKQLASMIEDAMAVLVMQRGNKRCTALEGQESEREREAVLLYVSQDWARRHATGR